MSLTAATLGCLFCFIALSGAESVKLALTFIISLSILMFYARRQGRTSKPTPVSIETPRAKRTTQAVRFPCRAACSAPHLDH